MRTILISKTVLEMEDKDRISGCLLGGVAGDEIANGPGLSESTFLALSSANGIIASRGNIEEKTFFSIAGKIARNIEKEYGKNFSESVIDIPIPGRDLLKANCLAGIVPIALFNHDYFFDGIQIAMIGGIIARIIDDNPHSFISAAVLAYIIFRLVEEDGGIGRTEFLGILDDGKRLVANFIDFETGCTISELYKDEMESGNRLMDRAIKMALGNISDNEPVLGPSGYQETGSLQ